MPVIIDKKIDMNIPPERFEGEPDSYTTGMQKGQAVCGRVSNAFPKSAILTDIIGE